MNLKEIKHAPLETAKTLLPLEVYAYFNRLSINEMIVNLNVLKLKHLANVGLLNNDEIEDRLENLDENNLQNLLEDYDEILNTEDLIFYTSLDNYKVQALLDNPFSKFVSFYVNHVNGKAKDIYHASDKVEICLYHLPQFSYLHNLDVIEKFESVEDYVKYVEEQLKDIEYV